MKSPTPEAILRIGRAIEQLEQEHLDFFTTNYHPNPALYTPFVTLTTPLYSNTATFPLYRRHLLLFRKLLQWRHFQTHLHMQVVRKWQVSEVDVNMEWVVESVERVPLLAAVSRYGFTDKGLVHLHDIDNVVPPPSDWLKKWSKYMSFPVPFAAALMHK